MPTGSTSFSPSTSAQHRFSNDSGNRIGYRRSRSRPATSRSVVVLRGLKDDIQVSDLLRVYLEEQREGGVEDDLLPFDAGAISVLRDVSDGRVGILLSRARELFDFAAEQGAPRITGELASMFFAGADTSDLESGSDDGSGPQESDIDDLLLGNR